MIVFVYANTSKQVGEGPYQGVRKSGSAETGFEENDPEGVALEYEVLEQMNGPPA